MQELTIQNLKSIAFPAFCNRAGAYFIPSIAEIFFVFVFLVLWLMPQNPLLNDGDTAFHIRIGQHILETRSVPTEDFFSQHNPKPKWVAHEWLSEVIMAVVYGWHGLSGIVAFFSFLIALQCYLLFRFLQLFSEHIFFVSAVMLLSVASMQLHWLARPHIFSMLITFVWYVILERYQHDGKKCVWLLPGLMMLWGNLHGGYLAGFILNLVYMIGNFLEAKFIHRSNGAAYQEKAAGIFRITLICIIAVLVNPYGYHTLLFPFQFMGQKLMIDNISEFLSPNFHSLDFLSFELTVIFLISGFFLSFKKIDVIHLGLLIVFLHLSLHSCRYIPLFAIFAAPVLLRQFASLRYVTDGRIYRRIHAKALEFSQIDKNSKGVLWAAASTLVVIAVTSGGFAVHDFDREKKPLDAIEFIKHESIPGAMFNKDEFGDFLITYAYPQYKVFIDGRMDMYGTDLLKEYLDIISFNPGWEDLLAKYNITWIFFQTDSQFSRFLQVKPDWVMIYSDKVTSIFLKDIPLNQGLIEKYRNRPAGRREETKK